MAEQRRAAGGLGRVRLKRLLKSVGYADGTAAGVTVDAAEYAPLRDLVAEAARVVRVPAPEHLRLSTYGEIAVTGDSSDGRTLHIGAPFVLGLPAVELKAVVAHSLAVLKEPHPELADALARICQDVQSLLDFLGGDGFGRRYRRLLAATAGFREDIERRADRAAAAVAGSREQALIALVRSRAVTGHFVEYAPRYLVEGLAPPEDLFTNWLRVAALPVPTWAAASTPSSQPGVRTVFHPGLTPQADVLDRARQAVNPVIPGEGLPVIAGLTAETAKALISGVEADPEDHLSIDYGASGQAVIDAAGRLLGRDATPADVVGVVADGRGPELAGVWDEVTVAQLEDSAPDSRVMERVLADTRTSAPTPGEMLEAFLAGLAVRREYRYDPVLGPGVLLADGRPGIEIHAAIGKAVAGDVTALGQLVDQLAGSA
ncbi:hypothetical protein [Catenulispora subtropica]|uniref:Uncharacterized protein n=1 Tax=Catenulispora subtropica TaxID=450798 RepID=A0ABN2S5K2_9ACTN